MPICSGWPSTGGNSAIITTDRGNGMSLLRGEPYTTSPYNLFGYYRYDGLGPPITASGDLFDSFRVDTWSKSGSMLVTRSGNSVLCRNSDYRTLWTRTINKRADLGVPYIEISKDESKIVVTASLIISPFTRQLYFLDSATGSTVWSISDGTTGELGPIAISPDGGLIAWGHIHVASNTALQIYDSNGAIVARLQAYNGTQTVSSIRFNADGTKLMIIFNSTTVNRCLKIFTVGTWQELTPPDIEIRYSGQPQPMDVSEDGKYLAVAWPSGGTAQARLIDCSRADPSQWVQLAAFSGRAYNAAAFAPNSRILALGGSPTASLSGLTLYDVLNNTTLVHPTLAELPGNIAAVYFNRKWR